MLTPKLGRMILTGRTHYNLVVLACTVLSLTRYGSFYVYYASCKAAHKV